MFNPLYLILLLEGFVTISIEILAIRQLIPFFGSSVIITSLIIGIFLLFLALGYWRGGHYQTDFHKRLSRNFIYASLCLGIGLSYAFLLFFFVGLAITLQVPLLLTLFLYLLLVLAPIVYWLGQTIPLATNLFNQQYRISKISGRALFLSTIGSFLGALITALLLFQYLGVAWTLGINCLLLFFLVLCLRPYSGISWFALLLFAIATYCMLQFNIGYEKGTFQLTNNYANYRIYESPPSNRILEINLSPSSQYNSMEQGYPYIEYIRNLLFTDLRLKDKNILIIGAGGFSLD